MALRGSTRMLFLASWALGGCSAHHPGTPDGGYEDAERTIDALPSLDAAHAADALASLDSERAAADTLLSSDVGAPPPGFERVDPTVLRVCLPIAEHTCREAIECGCDDGPGIPIDLDVCLRHQLTYCSLFLDLERAAVGAGRARIDDGAFAECLRGAVERSPACRALDMGPGLSLCPPFVILHAELGAPCEGVGLACAGGEGRCDPTGTCSVAPEHGEGCRRGDATNTCATGSICLDGLCRRIEVTVGAPCERDDGEPPLLGVCLGPLTCIENVCAPRRGLGEPCPTSDACAVGLVCGPVGRCVAEPEDPEDCSVAGGCGRGDVCLLSTTCVDFSMSAVGSPCIGGRCGRGQYCDALDTCQALVALGATCDQDGMCASGLCGEEGCVVPPGEGQPCEGTCSPGLHCPSVSAGVSRCAPLGGVGTSCIDSSGCLPDTYCEGGLCVPVLALGDACSHAAEGSCGTNASCSAPYISDEAICRRWGSSPGDPCLVGCDSSRELLARSAGRPRFGPQICGEMSRHYYVRGPWW